MFSALSIGCNFSSGSDICKKLESDPTPASLPALVQALDHGGDDYWSSAFDCMSSYLQGIDSSVSVPALAKAMESGDRETKKHAAHLLGSMGPKAHQATPSLLETLQDQDIFVWTESAVALARISPDMAARYVHPIMNTLAHQVEQGDVPTRRRAVQAFNEMREIAQPWVRALNHAGVDRRNAAIIALSNFGPKAAPAVPLLMRCLKESDEKLRLSATYTLGAIGPLAHKAIPALRQALNDGNPGVRSNASVAIERITEGGHRNSELPKI